MLCEVEGEGGSVWGDGAESEDGGFGEGETFEDVALWRG